MRVKYGGKVIKFPDSMSTSDIERALSSESVTDESKILSGILAQLEQEMGELERIREQIPDIDLTPIVDALKNNDNELLAEILFNLKEMSFDVDLSGLDDVLSSHQALLEAVTALQNRPKLRESEVTQRDANQRVKRVKHYYEDEV